MSTGIVPNMEVAVVAGANGDVTVPRMTYGDAVVSVYSTVGDDYYAVMTITTGGKLNCGNTTGKTLIITFIKHGNAGPLTDGVAATFQHSNL